MRRSLLIGAEPGDPRARAMLRAALLSVGVWLWLAMAAGSTAAGSAAAVAGAATTDSSAARSADDA